MSSLTAADFKNAGNKLCSLFRYDEAISYYDQAIAKNSEVPVFFSNRALCYLKLKQWPEAIQDCRRALELDPNLIKAHFFLGQALSEIRSYDDALKHLQRAHELAKERKMNFGDDIAYQIRLIKRNRWNKIESETALLEDELREYVLGLIRKDIEQQEQKNLQVIRGEGTSSQSTGQNQQQQQQQQQQPQVCMPSTSTSSPAIQFIKCDIPDCHAHFTSHEAMTKHKMIHENILPSSSSPNKLELQQQQQQQQQPQQQEDLQSKCDNYINKLESMFEDLKLQRKKRDVPDYLCGKISFEIMHDPVITPSGITYDRQDIEEHLRRVGHFDPITRQPLVASQLIPNLAMKEVVDAYLHDNEWAHYY